MDAHPAIGQIGGVTGDPEILPLNQLARLRTEHFCASAMHHRRLFDDPALTVELGVVARVCLNDWVRGDDFARPDKPVEAISIRRIAASLGSSAETSRRRINVLRDMGVVAISPDGVSLAATAENAALVERYYFSAHDVFVQLIEDIHATCDVTLRSARGPGVTRQDLTSRAFDMLLLPIDTYRPIYNNSTAFYLWAALTAVAVRGITYDPRLARLYANAMPPDEIRTGISLRAFAEGLEIAYATAWRHMQFLEKRNLVTRLADDRWTVAQANLTVGVVREIRDAPILWLIRKLRELTALGLDPAQAADHYVYGRPERADLGTGPVV